MNWNRHFVLPGAHALLSASKYHWVNYDDEAFDDYLTRTDAAKRGTELHQLAHDLIRLGVKLPKNNKTLNMYVNDALGYRMTPEQLLFYSEHCFGTPDAISFSERLGRDLPPILRISDLKTGTGPTSEKQLLVYAAMFCLEYKWDPMDIEIELRIYQNDEVREYAVDPPDVKYIMEKIKRLDELVRLRNGGEL